MGHVIISGVLSFACAKVAEKTARDPTWEMYKTTQQKTSMFHGSESLHRGFLQGKTHTCFYNSLLKTEEQWNDVTSGSVKTSVTVGKMIREVKGPLLTFTIRILSDCYSVWPGPNVYIQLYITYINILFMSIYIYLNLHTYNTVFFIVYQLSTRSFFDCLVLGVWPL